MDADVETILSIALIGTALWLLSVLWFHQAGDHHDRPVDGRDRVHGLAVPYLSERAVCHVGGHRSVDGDFDGRGRQLYLCWTRSVLAIEDNTWRKFDLTAIDAEIAKGNTVLVDVTWTGV